MFTTWSKIRKECFQRPLDCCEILCRKLTLVWQWTILEKPPPMMKLSHSRSPWSRFGKNYYQVNVLSVNVVFLLRSVLALWNPKLSQGKKTFTKHTFAENSSQGSSSQLSRSSSTASNSPKEEETSQTENRETKDTPAGSVDPKQTSFPANPQDTTDSVRLKCRGMIVSALKTERKLPLKSSISLFLVHCCGPFSFCPLKVFPLFCFFVVFFGGGAAVC